MMHEFKAIQNRPLPETLGREELADLLEDYSNSYRDSDPYLYELLNVAADTIRARDETTGGCAEGL